MAENAAPTPAPALHDAPISALVERIWNEFDAEMAERRRIADARPNILLAEALRYYAARRTMNNPKGWAHVQRVVEKAVTDDVFPTTAEHRAEARAILAVLAASENPPAAGDLDDDTAPEQTTAAATGNWLMDEITDAARRYDALPVGERPTLRPASGTVLRHSQ